MNSKLFVVRLQLSKYVFFPFRNPTKGIIINHPKGKDVYKGVPHDYIGDVRFLYSIEFQL
jgi:hypothetical protein